MTSFWTPPLPDLPHVRVVARWRDGRASNAEVAALRRFLPVLRDRPAAEVFREARASAEWVLATCHPAHATWIREQAERAGLVAAVVPGPPRHWRPVPEEQVIAELTAGGLAVADFVVVAGALCSLHPNGQLMAHIIEDGGLAAATRAFLRRVGVREYGSFQEFTAAHRPKPAGPVEPAGNS